MISSRSHILRDKRRSTATPLATGREALLARDFPTHPHLDRFDHLDRLLAVVLIFGARLDAQARLFGYSNLRATPRVGHLNTYLITMPIRISHTFVVLESLKSFLVRRESAEICDSSRSHILRDKRRSTATPLAVGTRGAPRKTFSHPPTP